MPPTTTEGIEKYLGSGMIRGIGPAYARKLVRAFGSQVFDVIEAEPHRLREVAGIGPKRADGIATGWAEQQAIGGRIMRLKVLMSRLLLSENQAVGRVVGRFCVLDNGMSLSAN